MAAVHDKTGHDAAQTSDVEKKDAGSPGPPTFPDGGLRAWMTVAGAWLVMFCTFGYINAFGVYEAYYLQHYLPTKSPFQIAWISLMFAGGGIAGRLFDEGYFYAMIIPASILLVFGLMMTSLATEYYSIFLAQGVAMGLAIGFLFLPTVGCISHHFQKKRALATGIVVTGSSIGGIIFPVMLNNLFNSSVGFGWGVRASAFLIMGCLAAACALMSTRLPGRKARPAHMQKKPDMKAIITDAAFIINMIGFVSVTIFAEQKGLDTNISFYSLTILNGASVFGRVLPNFLADKSGSMNMMIPCVFMSGVLNFVMLACGSKGGVVVFAILYGFFSGAYVSLIPTVIVGFARDFTEIGVRLGLTFVASSFGALFGTPIAGALVGEDYRFWRGATFSGVMVLFGTACIVVARMLQAKRKGTQLL